MPDVINFRSDTQTLPTHQMLQAMLNAPLGDDVFGEDPTVNKLETMAAALLGKESAMLVPSGTMGNLVCLMTHAQRGDEVIIDPESHIFYYEAGGLASVAGLMPMPVTSHNGMLDPNAITAAIRKRDVHFPYPKLLCLENTHNRAGGRVLPLELHKQICRVARDHGLAVHLDGARIFNAAIAAKVPASAYAAEVDSVMFCLSKGLSCPVGSLVVGSRAFIDKARHNRKRIGGAMRQAGIIAAAGIVALETMIDRMAEDHANAKTLAVGLAQIPGLSVDLAGVETNMVYVDHTSTGLTTDQIVERLKTAGVLVSTRPPTHFRMVTTRHHNRDLVAEALRRIHKALAEP